MLASSGKLEHTSGENEEAIKILVVDDDTEIREVLFHILTQEGYKAQTVPTGKDAIEACQKDLYDVALIDIKLSDMEGTNVLNITKKLNPMMTAIMITGYPSLENAVQALNFGADCYLIKPFNPLKLLETVKEQLERRRRAKLENLLKNTGLSPYETKLYLSLALEGPSEARKLSQSSGVPRTKTYMALKKLKQRGLVIEVPGMKQRFSISPPSGAFSAFVDGWKKDLSEQATSLAALENAISLLEVSYVQKQAAKPLNMQKEEVWSIQGSKGIAQRTQEMLNSAETSVCAITTEKGLAFFCRDFGKILDTLVEKGVSIQIKTPIGPSNMGFVKELRYAYKIANAQVPVPVFLLTVDEKQLLLAKLKTDGATTVFDDELGVFAKSESLVPYFVNLLAASKHHEPKQ